MTNKAPSAANRANSGAVGWCHSARFLTTASLLEQLQPTELPEVAFVGRSNAGKSTAINTLAQQRRLAFASRTPGRTQHINLFELGPKDAADALWADLPGYGYAAVERAAKLRWQQEMANYLQWRRSLSGVVLMVDSRHGLMALDRQLLSFIAPRIRTGTVKLLVLLTKADKLNRKDAARALRETTEALGAYVSEQSDVGVTLFSALNGQGVGDAQQTLHQWAHPGPRLFDIGLPHGITLACRANESLESFADQAADTRPRALLLHGFPEAAFAWDDILQGLQGQVRALAPNLRGFAGSSAPSGPEAYRAKHLMQDISALIEQLGAPIDLLVAHDWGGAVAWSLAALRPELMRRLLIINSPHTATFLRDLRTDGAQQQASAYMNFLCRPDAAQLLAQDDYRRLWGFFNHMGAAGESASWLSESMKSRYREVWDQGLDGGLNYYRASPLKPAQAPEDALHRLDIPEEALRVTVPTTVLWGEADHALLPGLLNGLERHVPQMRLVRVPEATHWIVHERPELVLQVILEDLGKTT